MSTEAMSRPDVSQSIATTQPAADPLPAPDLSQRAGWPYARDPSGWFQVGWSSEVGAGDVIPVQAFGADLVLGRGTQGEVRAFDAFCPHLGAHLGHGGVVQDGNVICPFHGWEWGPEGENVRIPYSTKVMPNLRLRSWPVREIDGLIVVWHDADGGQPTWEPEPISTFVASFDPCDYHPLFPGGVHLWPSVRVQPQFVVENIVDSAHFRYVHAAAHGSVIIGYDANGHVFSCSQRFEGRRPATLDMWARGVGLMLGVFSVDGAITHVEVQATTPLAGQRSTLRGSVWVRSDPGQPGVMTPKMASTVQLQHDQLGNDIPIWEHMRYRAHAPLVPEESTSCRALRKWAAQFYPAESSP